MSSDLSIPLIALEEHYCSPDLIDGAPHAMYGGQIGDKLISLSDRRISDMNTGGVSRQVMSHTPFRKAPTPEACYLANTQLSNAVRDNPDRLSAFAALPMLYPKEAAEELRRAVRELHLVGALVDNHSQGTFYDDSKFDPVWEVAQELDVPIYLHPSFASDAMMQVNYTGNFPEAVGSALARNVFGWHTETGLHFLRLFAAGLFDRFPHLKIVLGHMGECIPFMIDRQARGTRSWTHLQRPILEVWRSNIYVTTSGMFETAPLRCLLACTPLEHVMFSVDYPFSSNEMGAEFVKLIEKEGVLKGDDLKAFASSNAEKLLKVKA